MITDVSAPILTPYPYTADESSYARAAWSWAIGGRHDLMCTQLSKLPPAALRDVIQEAAEIARAAAGLLGVPPVPDGVVGQRIGHEVGRHG